MSDLTPTEIAAWDAGYWAVLNKIRLQASTFSFENHEYQIEPMSSTARRRVYMKATQGGWTEIEVLRSLHAMIHGHHPQGDLYMFPTTDNVQEFSKSRFNPLILANREAIGKYVKSAGRGTDTASLKKIHSSFLYLRGARLSQKASEQNESSQMRGIPVDSIKFDEYDLMDEAVAAKARGRMGHSLIKEEVFLSNPLVPGEGIDKVFSVSDQRHWFRKCGCGEWTCAELSFPECVKRRSDGTGYIGCNKCGKELPIWAGDGSAEWVPSVRDNSNFMHGYRWSQLTSVYNDPAMILEAFTNPPEGNLADVYRLRLGLPYIAAEDRLTEAQVYGCCGNYLPSVSHDGPCAMGVDVGKIKHVVIGIKTGNDQYQIVKMARVSKWEDIHGLANRFNVKSAVIDIRPYEDSARKFQEEAKFKTYLCEYKENQPQDYVYRDKSGRPDIVAANRTQIFDLTHRLVITPGMLTIPRMCPEVKEFAKQMCGAYKILETNKKTGVSVYRYKGNYEHYRNAMNYFMLAAKGHRIVSINKSRHRQTVANNEYVRC